MLNASCTTVAVLGVPFHNVTMDETVALIEEQVREGTFHQVATANVDFLKNSIKDKRLRDILLLLRCCCSGRHADRLDVSSDRRPTEGASERSRPC